MLKSDFLFNYINITRFILLHKDLIKNSFLIPKLFKAICYFPLKNLEDIDDVRIYNYFYFFKFFLGFRAFFIGYRSIQSFSKTTYDFKIQIILKQNDVFPLLSFFVYDILPILDVDYYSINLIKSKLISYHFLIKDMNIFSEKKTNLGLFNLKDNLNFDLFFNSLNKDSVKLFFCNIKLYFLK